LNLNFRWDNKDGKIDPITFWNEKTKQIILLESTKKKGGMINFLLIRFEKLIWNSFSDEISDKIGVS
jgi:hypothetical protein